MEFTRQEIQAILSTVDTPIGFYDWEELLAAIGEAIDIDALTEAQVATAFTGPATQEVLDVARVGHEREARRIAGNLATAELKKVASKVTAAIEEGRNFETLYRELEEIRGLDDGRAATYSKYVAWLEEQDFTDAEIRDKAEREYQRLLKDRRKVIAQTETSLAQGQGNNAIALAQDAKFKRWDTSGDSLVSDACQANEAQGWIPIDEAFSSGDMFEPNHPRCRCSVVYRKTVGPSAQQNAKEQAEKTKEAKDSQ